MVNRQFVDKRAQCGGHLIPAHMVPLWQQYYCEPISTEVGITKEGKMFENQFEILGYALGEKKRTPMNKHNSK